MAIHIEPTIRHLVGKSGIDYGIEIHVARVNEYGDHSNGFSFGELTIADLKRLHDVIGHYLDEGQYQE